MMLLVLVFIESFATVLVQRAVYFFTRNRLGFSDTSNLLLALMTGVVYVVGALSSHPISRRIGERRLLAIMIAGQLLIHASLAAMPVAGVVFAGAVTLGLLNGMKWPLVESYISAGRTPSRQAKAIGQFNVTWATAVPLSLMVAGPLIAWKDWGLFAFAGSLNVAGLLLLVYLPARPVHLPADHPDRPGAAPLRRFGHLLLASRSLMLVSYSAMWIVAALIPGIFARLGHGVGVSTAMSGMLDVARVTAFAVLGFWTAWHGRRAGLLRCMLLLPAGFFLIVLAPGTWAVLVGELLFGWAAGESYYAALYYAMLVKNASVDAGGAHEGLIGSGFALGPAVGLLGRGLGDLFGHHTLGMLCGVGPLFLAGFALVARSMWKLARSDRAK